ncbi:MAG: hypothetical protein ACOWW1_02130 [archaeon]
MTSGILVLIVSKMVIGVVAPQELFGPELNSGDGLQNGNGF